VKPRAEVLRMQRDADVQLYFEFGDAEVPSGKLYEYVSSGTSIWRIGPASDTIGMRIIEKTHTGEDIGNDHHAVADRLIRLAEGGDCPIIDADARAIQSFDRATGAQRLLFEAERRLTDP